MSVMAAGVPWNWETFPAVSRCAGAARERHRFRRAAAAQPAARLCDGRARREPRTADRAGPRRDAPAHAPKPSGRCARRHDLAQLCAPLPRRPLGAFGPRPRTRNCWRWPQGLRDAGTGVFQMVPSYDIDRDRASSSCCARIAETSGRPVSFTFMQTPHAPGDWKQTLQRPRGGEARRPADPRPGHPAPDRRAARSRALATTRSRSTRATARSSTCRSSRRSRACAIPSSAGACSREQPEDPQPVLHLHRLRSRGDVRAGRSAQLQPARRGQHRGAARARSAVDPRELIYDALLERDGHAILYRPIGNIEGERFESSRPQPARHARYDPRAGRRRRALQHDLRRGLHDLFADLLGARRGGGSRSTLPRAVSKLPPSRRGRSGLDDRGCCSPATRPTST